KERLVDQENHGALRLPFFRGAKDDFRRMPMHRHARFGLLAFLVGATMLPLAAQPPNARIGEAVPRDVRELYDKGLQYLAKTQSDSGDSQGGHDGPGVTGMALMVFLASGEDPNFGIYSNNVRKAIRSIV